MTLKPVFEIGWWNAWILMLFIVMHPFLMSMVDQAIGTGGIIQKMGDAPADKAVKRASYLPSILLYLLFICSIFLPLKIGTIWFYAGLLVYLIGITIFLSALVTAVRTPMGQVFSTGSYRYSRHPLYLSFLVIFLGISIATASWLFLLLSMAWTVFPIRQVDAEERGCLEIFGDNYKEYKDSTPRWFGLPKPR